MIDIMRPKKKHQWSGWPGAFCLNCGAPDQNEICIGIHDKLDYVCTICGEHWPQGECITGEAHDVVTIACPEHVNGPCPA